MTHKLSNRVKSVKPSPTLAITARAAELRAAGNDVIGLGAGEPDFDTPEHIKQAAIQAINDGKTKYTPVDGTASLKQAVIDKFKRDNGLDYNADQILVSSGGKQSFYNWSVQNNYPISSNMHPLELSHAKAAEYWLPFVRTLLNTRAKEDYLHAFK